MIIQDLTLTRYKKKNSLVINKDIKSLLFQKFVVSLQRIKPVHLICYMLSYCTIKETDKGIGNANPLFFCLEKVASCLLFLFLYPWSSKNLAVSDCFHSANTLPFAKRMLFTMSMMLGIGYSPMRRIENSMAEMR